MKSTGRAPIVAVLLPALLLVATAAGAQTDSLEACVAALRRELPRHPEVSRRTFDTFTRDAEDLRPKILEASRSQPEFVLPIWDYTARLVDRERIEDGRAILRSRSAPLQAIATTHRVDAATIVAVFGVETDYGRIEGRYRVVDATLSRACLDLRNEERKRHFFAALWLLQQRLVRPDDFRGSWAGAFGLTQFMPATFVEHMADGDASGTIDIVGNPLDALATTARYIAALGWNDGLRWGVEVSVPRSLDARLIASEAEHACLASGGADRHPGAKCRTVAQWVALGVENLADAPATVTTDGSTALPLQTPAALLAPAGIDGPTWLVTRNYRAIWHYNRADAYALAIGLLADALRGDPPVRAPWPTDDPGLSRAELRQLQEELVRQGYAQIVPDGYDGPLTRAAVKSEERARGWPETGRPGRRIAQAIVASSGRSPQRSPASGEDGPPHSPGLSSP